MRNVFVIGPDKKIKLILVYPMTTGRNFDEVLRVIDSLQLTAKHKVATPVNWKPGEDVIIAGSVTNDEAKEIFGEWESPSPTSASSPNPSSRVAVRRMPQPWSPWLRHPHHWVPGFKTPAIGGTATPDRGGDCFAASGEGSAVAGALAVTDATESQTAMPRRNRNDVPSSAVCLGSRSRWELRGVVAGAAAGENAVGQ